MVTPYGESTWLKQQDYFKSPQIVSPSCYRILLSSNTTMLNAAAGTVNNTTCGLSGRDIIETYSRETPFDVLWLSALVELFKKHLT